MPRTVFQLRRVGLISVGVLCVLAGVVLVYMLVRPGVLGRTSTLQLAIVAGLLVWPGVTFLLMRMDNVVVRRGKRAGRGSMRLGLDEPEERPRSAA